jgi:hypothetical protein
LHVYVFVTMQALAFRELRAKEGGVPHPLARIVMRKTASIRVLARRIAAAAAAAVDPKLLLQLRLAGPRRQGARRQHQSRHVAAPAVDGQQRHGARAQETQRLVEQPKDERRREKKPEFATREPENEGKKEGTTEEKKIRAKEIQNDTRATNGVSITNIIQI